MLIPVIYLDGKHDLVKDFYLTELIEQQQILSFKRREGWVSASGPRIRQKNHQNPTYFGPERRGKHHQSGASLFSQPL